MFNIEYEWFLRLICATLVGGLIGFERHTKLKDAGIRTHAIVALAAATVMLVSKYGFAIGEADHARIAAQAVSGVGFLGAGIIFVRNDLIQGLTTAAGIWATAAVGLCFGVGFYHIGFFGGIMILVIQSIVAKFFNHTSAKTMMSLKILMNHDGKLKDISSLFHSLGYVQSDTNISPADSKEHWYLTTGITGSKDMDPSVIIGQLETLNGVEEVRLI